MSEHLKMLNYLKCYFFKNIINKILCFVERDKERLSKPHLNFFKEILQLATAMV